MRRLFLSAFFALLVGHAPGSAAAGGLSVSVTPFARDSDAAPSQTEWARALALLRGSRAFRAPLASGALVAYPPMPPRLDARPEVVLVGLRPAPGAAGRHEIVGVDLSSGALLRFAGGAPPHAHALATTCGPPPFDHAPLPRGTPGWSEVTVTRGGEELWRFVVVRPSSSTGTNGSGLELRDVRYRGRLVLARAHTPIFNVRYAGAFCGPFRDEMWHEAPFDASGEDVAEGIRLASAPPHTIFDSGQDGGGFTGVALFPQSDRLVVTTELEAGWYRYTIQWSFLDDGRMQPRIGFTNVANSCTCSPHVHHGYLRLDFAVAAAGRERILASGASGDVPVETEASGLRAAGLSWRVVSTLTGDAWRVVPGAADGTADAYGKGDWWIVRGKGEDELDDGETCTSCATTYAQLGRFVDGESLDDQDVVLWYAVHVPHGGDEGAEALVGPDIVPEGARPATDWPQFGFDPSRAGANPAETTLGEEALPRVTPLFSTNVREPVAGAPVLARAVATPSGARDLLVVETQRGNVAALDAATGAIVWTWRSGAACRVHGGAVPCTTAASPALDPRAGFVYAYALDGFVHRLALGDGHEVTGNGWPVRATWKPQDERASAPLGLVPGADGKLYLTAAHASYPGDQGDYQGHVTVVDTATGAARVFDAPCAAAGALVPAGGGAACGEIGSGVWGRAGVAADVGAQRLFFATGNGAFDPAAGRWGESVVSVPLTGALAVADSYTPSSDQLLTEEDLDLGSASPALLGDARSGRFLLQGGKDGVLRLLGRGDLSGQGGAGHVGGALQELSAPGGAPVLTAPAVTRDASGTWWAYVADDAGLTAYRLDTSGTPRLVVAWRGASGGTSPVVADGLVWLLTSGSLLAYRATDGVPLFSANAGKIHWQSPIVVNGAVYFGDEEGNVSAFAPAPTALGGGASAPGNPAPR